MESKKYITLKEIHDEDYKTQLAKGYPNIPKGAEVELVKIFSNYYGNFIRIKYNGICYDTYLYNIKEI